MIVVISEKYATNMIKKFRAYVIAGNKGYE